VEESEPRFVWKRLLATNGDKWADVKVVALRDLSGVGLGLFAADGFYPDFLLCRRISSIYCKTGCLAGSFQYPFAILW